MQEKHSPPPAGTGVEAALAWNPPPRPLTDSRLILLYRGGPDAQPCYRLHLATAIVRRLEPKTADELVARVLPACAPAHAIETLLVAYREWKERQR